jgi:hypothetical protein
VFVDDLELKFKLALQAAGYIGSPTQGAALGLYKLAFQAGNASNFKFGTVICGCELDFTLFKT